MKPVSKTAYYCGGVRMQDAESNNPLVGDTYARQLLGEEGLKYWESFKPFKNPNASNIARCYLIDRHLKKALAENPATTIILIGAGLDSRAFRLSSGRWIELDEPGIMEYKEQVLPASQCKNKLQRISIDFQNEKLADKLSAFSDLGSVVFVVEGVLMYLTHDQRSELLSTLRAFKKHIFICDLMSLRFFNVLAKRGLHKKFKEGGASFKDLAVEPARLFLDNGYRQLDVDSCILTASKYGLASVPGFVVKLFRRLFMGYSVYKFEWQAV